MRGIRRWLRLRSVERDLDEELAFHREQRVRELEARGLSRDAARQEAGRLFGDEARYRRELLALDRSAAAERRWRLRAEAAGETVRHATRSLVRSPGLAAGIILAFALGIGANAVMFGTVERLLLRPPAHVAEPDQVRRIFVERQRGFGPPGAAPLVTQTVAFPDYEDFARASGFSEVAAYAARQLVAGRGEDAQRLRVVYATAQWWPLLGADPALGRFFTAEEDVVDAAPVVVISHAYWQRQYGGSRAVLGQAIDFGDGDWTIIGVAPRGFTGVDLTPVDAFIPFRAYVRDNGRDWLETRNWHFLRAVARLSPGVTDEAAAAEATAHYRAGRASWPGSDPEAKVRTAPLLLARGPDAPAEATVSRWLLGVAGVVFLIACLNVANLLLARMLRQGRETAVRLALGISRRRLLAQMLAEGLILGLLGGAAALIVSRWGGTLVQRLLLPDVEWGGPTTTTLLLVAGLAIVAGVASALAPALQATRRDVVSGLRASGSAAGRAPARAQATLSALQAAFSVILLVGAGLFVRSLDRVHAADMGLDPWQVAILSPEFERGSLSDDEDARPVYAAAVERVRALPTVSAATATLGIPFYSSYAYELHVPGVDSIPRLPGGGPYVMSVDPGYFETMRIALRRGRTFASTDVAGAPLVAVVSESFAATLWPGSDPLGRCIRFPGPQAPCREVVGVVADTRRDGVIEEASLQYYVPLAQEQATRVDGVLVRARGDLPTAMRDARAALHAADSRIRYVTTVSFDDLLAPQLRQWRLGAALFTLFGLLALVVAATGLYSVLAFGVAQRVREIGVRAALGATRNGIVALVVMRALRIAGAGTLAGAAVAWLLAPRLQPLLYDVQPRDPLTFGLVLGVLALVALFAAGVPARRAARLDPNAALRTE